MEYSNITSDDIPQIIECTQKYLTDGEEIKEEIELSAEEENYFGVKATEGGELIGFLTIKKGIQFTCPHPYLEREIRKAANRKTVSFVDGIWVCKNHRGKGVSGELARRTKKLLKDIGAEYIFIEEWIYPDGHIPAERLLSSYGEPVYEKEIPMFYRDMAKYGMKCPICGENCKCGAKIKMYNAEGAE